MCPLSWKPALWSPCTCIVMFPGAGGVCVSVWHVGDRGPAHQWHIGAGRLRCVQTGRLLHSRPPSHSPTHHGKYPHLTHPLTTVSAPHLTHHGKCPPSPILTHPLTTVSALHLTHPLTTVSTLHLTHPLTTVSAPHLTHPLTTVSALHLTHPLTTVSAPHLTHSPR